MEKENNNISTVGQEGGLVNQVQGLFDKVKSPVFWVAIGFVTCKFLDRKKKRVVSL